MRVRDVRLSRIRPGMFLLLGDDKLLEENRAIHLFCEPAEVLAVYRGQEPNDRTFIRDGGLVLRAVGWEDRGNRWICLEMAQRQGGRVRVCFPDDRHLVSPVRVWTPAEHVKILAERDRRCARWMVTDPVTGHRHDGRDLSAYRLPAFWRDASVVWHALPVRWVGKHGWLSELAVLEAISGVRQPAPGHIRASETKFHEDVTIGIATLCWKDATVLEYGENGALDPVLAPVLHRLVDAFGSAARLRAAAIRFVDERLAASSADPIYLEGFKHDRRKAGRRVVAPRASATHLQRSRG